MRNSLANELLKIKRQTISKNDLEALLSYSGSYEVFAREVLALEKAEYLQMVKAKGRSTRTPSLAHQYRINKHALRRTYHQQLQAYRMKFDNVISLDAYFTLDSTTWEADLPYLEQINEYIFANGLPTDKVPAPERSFALFGDEKFIENKGKTILSRVNLWEKMQIYPVTDPVRFAIQPAQVMRQKQAHLIVENKTTYQALLPVLTQTTCATLIYGEGNKITKSIENFTTQYPVNAQHRFLYFGDIDRSGIAIWHRLQQREGHVTPALPFYEACLEKAQAYGKTNQALSQDALHCFLSFFPHHFQEQMKLLLAEGAYYPQEVLRTKELQEIFIYTDWASYVEKGGPHD